MPFGWINNWDLAKELIDGLPADPMQYNDVDLAAMRCAVGRSYYAAYWTAREYIVRKFQYRVPGGESHIGILNRMRDEQGELADIADLLEGLKARRTRADYSITAIFNKRECETGLTLAKTIMDRIRALP